VRNYGRTSVHEFLGDFVVYRNLSPMDERLPTLDDVRARAGVPPDVTPRKSHAAYARVIVEMLRAARGIALPRVELERLIYIGDTRMNDGTAFANIATAAGWSGMAFIAAETDHPAPPQIVDRQAAPGRTTLYLADSWASIAAAPDQRSFEEACRERGFPIDEQTAVVVDLDKTALGARGRNDHVINQARVEAVRRTVGGFLGDAFDSQSFRTAYDVLNQAEYHPFTSDNQDYLAYICLILQSELYDLDALIEHVNRGQVASFNHFIQQVEDRADPLPTSLREIHERIYERVKAGDPTPFKTFRYNEYRATVERMGCLSDESPVEELLESEIVITQEVREAALRWKASGAVLFGLSDKPDEASLPTARLRAEGYHPIHRVETHAVGDGGKRE
jgi:hypothetical protein